MEVVTAVENLETGESDKPVQEVVIADCGELPKGGEEAAEKTEEVAEAEKTEAAAGADE